MTRRNLVLAGAGHAQLDLLAALARAPLADWDVSLVTPQENFHYSGLLPGVIAGTVSPSAATIEVARIARASGIRVHVDAVASLDAARRQMRLAGGTELAFDLLSLDVGSAVSALGVPGAGEHAYPMRPFSAAMALDARLRDVLATVRPGADVPAIVVGAGAAGVEIAMAIRARIARAGATPRVAIVDPAMFDGLPLPGFAASSRELASRALLSRGIERSDHPVIEVRADAVVTGGRAGTHVLPSFATAWVTGPAAHPWLAGSGLACDAAGYAFADGDLALDRERTIFGGGDCITLREHPATPRAGVFAVRMAPVLAANVLAVARGQAPPRRYVPQKDFLALLSTGDGSALLRWHGIALEGRWVQRLKTWIDESYLRRYRALAT